MDWVITLPDGDGGVSYRTAEGTWVGDVALARRYTDAEKARIEVPIDMGEPRWVWEPFPTR